MLIARVQVRGVNRTIARVQRHRLRARRCIGDNAPFIRRLLLAVVRYNFASESDDGTPWVPLSPDYAARKKGPQILIEAGEMISSLLGRTAHSIYSVSPLRLIYGTSDPKAKYHNHDDLGAIPPGRYFMPRASRLVGPIATRVRDYVQGTINTRAR